MYLPPMELTHPSSIYHASPFQQTLFEPSEGDVGSGGAGGGAPGGTGPSGGGGVSGEEVVKAPSVSASMYAHIRLACMPI